MTGPPSGVPWRAVRAVGFDVDGTLYRPGPVRRAMAVALLLACGPRPWRWRDVTALRVFRRCRERHAGARGPGLDAAQYEWAARELGRPAGEVRAVVLEWMHRRPLPHVARARRAGVREFFEALETRGIPVAVYSDFPARGKLEALGLEAAQVLCSTDADVDRMKPDPAGLLLAAERAGVPPGDWLYVGDRPELDGECARRAGMRYLDIGAMEARGLGFAALAREAASVYDGVASAGRAPGTPPSPGGP